MELLNAIFFFCHQKTIKNRQGLHKIIRDSLLSIIFFQSCISHHCENFQIYGKLHFLEDVLASQNIDSRYFYSYAATIPSISLIVPAVRTLLQVLSSPLRWPWLGILDYLYFKWFVIFSNVMALQFCRQNIYHIAW